MIIEHELNNDCLKVHNKVEKLFLFDNDSMDGLLYGILKYTFNKVVGLKTINNHTFQISYYTMPNNKVIAVAYPSCVVVNYVNANKDIKKFFNNIETQTDYYMFYLELINNGYPEIKLG